MLLHILGRLCFLVMIVQIEFTPRLNNFLFEFIY